MRKRMWGVVEGEMAPSTKFASPLAFQLAFQLASRLLQLASPPVPLIFATSFARPSRLFVRAIRRKHRKYSASAHNV